MSTNKRKSEGAFMEFVKALSPRLFGTRGGMLGRSSLKKREELKSSTLTSVCSTKQSGKLKSGSDKNENTFKSKKGIR